jgi:hypothetical protein
MNPKMKAFLTISAKQAVGAILGNTVLLALLPKTFNLHDWSSIRPLLSSTLGFIVAAEGKVWIPKLANWVNSPTPDGIVPEPPKLPDNSPKP